MQPVPSRITASMLQRGFAQHASAPQTYLVRADEGLEQGIARELMTPALAGRMADHLADAGPQNAQAPLSEDRVMHFDDHAAAIKDALSTTVHAHHKDFGLELIYNMPQTPDGRSCIGDEPLQHCIDLTRLQLDRKEQLFIDPHYEGLYSSNIENRPSAKEWSEEQRRFVKARREATDPAIQANIELDTLPENNVFHSRSLILKRALAAPVSAQTKAVVALRLAELNIKSEHGEHLAQFYREATHPETQAEALMYSAANGSSTAKQDLQQALSIARRPNTIAKASLALALHSKDGNIKLLRDAKNFARCPVGRGKAAWELATRGDSDARVLWRELTEACISHAQRARAYFELGMLGDEEAVEQLEEISRKILPQHHPTLRSTISTYIEEISRKVETNTMEQRPTKRSRPNLE